MIGFWLICSEMVIIIGCLEDVERTVIQLKSSQNIVTENVAGSSGRFFKHHISALKESIPKECWVWEIIDKSFTIKGEWRMKKTVPGKWRGLPKKRIPSLSAVFCLLQKLEYKKFSKTVWNKEKSYPFWVRSDMGNTLHYMSHYWPNDSCCLSSVLRKILRPCLGWLKKSAATSE